MGVISIHASPVRDIINITENNSAGGGLPLPVGNKIFKFCVID